MALHWYGLFGLPHLVFIIAVTMFTPVICALSHSSIEDMPFLFDGVTLFWFIWSTSVSIYYCSNNVAVIVVLVLSRPFLANILLIILGFFSCLRQGTNKICPPIYYSNIVKYGYFFMLSRCSLFCNTICIVFCCVSFFLVNYLCFLSIYVLFMLHRSLCCSFLYLVVVCPLLLCITADYTQQYYSAFRHG